MSDWFIYLIRTGAGALYTGMTTDVARRFAEHDAGGVRAARSLRGKGPLTLVYSARIGDRATAARLEYAIKQWPRQRKEALVAGRLPLPADPDRESLINELTRQHTTSHGSRE